MIGKRKIWNIQTYNKEKSSCLSAELGLSTLVTDVLVERGYDTVAKIREFLYGSDTPFHDPFLLKDMERSVQRITVAIEKKEKITVYGDYDVDGITASSLLFLYLQGKGAVVNTYIPKRENEGYGLNDDALKYLAAEGTGLVITVDCGISGYNEVKSAPSGMDIIITDHHTVPELLPPAFAVINPKQKDCAYPFKVLSGVGVAFKLCQALEKHINAGDDWWCGLTELAALGTVADIVPLVGENREIVRRGLKAMEQTELTGLRALMKVSGCHTEKITSESIGFILAPRLNAVGRLEHAQSAVELLVSKDEREAAAIAEKLNTENSLRQEISRKILEEAEMLLSREDHIDTAIVLASENWHQGVIGIVASRLVDKYHLPTILLSISGGTAKGSCRSVPALNLYEAINAQSDILLQFGGHHQAAGLTLNADKIDEFKNRFKQYVKEKLNREDYFPQLNIDCVLKDSGTITVNDLEELALLEPFGCDNPAPVFSLNNALLYNHRAIGKDRTHLQFNITKGDNSYKAVMWNKAELLPLLYDNMVADVAFMPKLNVWNGEESVQLHALSIKQQLEFCDFRHSKNAKDTIVKSFLRVNDKIDVFVNDRNKKISFSCDDSAVLYRYGEKPDSETAILYDYPLKPLQDIMQMLKKNAVKTVVAVFDWQDKITTESLWKLKYPDRDIMAAAYKKIMELLKIDPVLDRKQILEKYNDLLSENILAVMAELGFIVISGDKISMGVIRKCRLEDSSLFCRLQKEVGQLTDIVNDNWRITQHELLKN